MKRRKKPRTWAVLHQTKNGSWTLRTVTYPIVALPNGDHSQYTLVDYIGGMDMTVDCDGIALKPRVIFKVYCKPGKQNRVRILREKSLAKIRAGSPMLH